MKELAETKPKQLEGDESFKWYGAVLKLMNGLRQAVDHPLNLFPVLKMIPPNSLRNLQDELAKARRHASDYEQVYKQIDAYCNHNATKDFGPKMSDQTQTQHEDKASEMGSYVEYVLDSQGNKGCTLCCCDVFDELKCLPVNTPGLL